MPKQIGTAEVDGDTVPVYEQLPLGAERGTVVVVDGAAYGGEDQAFRLVYDTWVELD